MQDVSEKLTQNPHKCRTKTINAIFTFTVFMEKYTSTRTGVFVDLKKAHDRELRAEMWDCRRKSGVAEKYARLV